MTVAVPLPASRRSIFRGWHVVATLFMAGFSLYGAGLYSFILFVKPLSDEFHWSRTATGGLVSAFWLTSPIALFAAPLIRRFGSRKLAAAGVVIEAASLCLLFTASQLWEMYLLRALAGLGKMLYAINLPVIVSKWFSRKFGLAVAVIYCGWAIGGLALAPLTEYLIHQIGWRATSVVLGVGILLLALPPTLWVLRIESAKDAGLGLDGDPPGSATLTAEVAESPARQSTFIELLATPAFLLIAIATAAYYLTYSGVLAHQAAVVQGEAISSETASLILGMTAGFAAVGALLIGVIIDRMPFPWVIAVQFALMASGVVALLSTTYTASTALLTLHAMCFGLAIGGSEPFWITLIRRRLPFYLFQQAWGTAYFLELAFIIVGPIAAGYLFDTFHDYRAALWSEFVLIAIPLSIACWVWGGRRKTAPASRP
jgi:MFS family permease